MNALPRPLGLALAGIALVLGLVMMFEPGGYPGEAGDTRLNLYMLEHGWRWLAGLDASFWNAPFFHPAPLAFAYSDNHLGTLAVYAALRAAGFARDPAFAGWMIVMFALNFGVAAWVLRRLGAGAAGAAAGAFVFAFGLPVMMQTGHPQLVPRFFVPLAFLALVRLRESGSAAAFAALAGACVAQWYVAMYNGYFLAVSIAVALACAALLDRGAFVARMLGGDARARLVRLALVAAALLALLPLAWPYLAVFRGGAADRADSLAQVLVLLPEPASFLHTTRSSLLWGALDRFGQSLVMAHEKRLFVGALPLLALAAVPWTLARGGLEPRARASLAMASACFVLLALLVVKIGAFSPYRVATLLPGAASFRAVGRYLLVALFPLAIVVALTIDAWTRRRGRAGGAIAAAVLALVIVDQWAWHVPQMSFAESRARVAEVRTEIERANQRGAFYYDVAGDPAPHARQVDAMLAAAELGLPTVNGYAASVPPGYPIELVVGTAQPCAALEGWRSLHPGEPLAIVGGDPCGELPITVSRTPIARADLAFDAALVDPVVACGPATTVRVAITNLGGRTWPAGLAHADRRFQIRYGWRVLAADGKAAGGFDRRDILPHDVAPGERIVVPLELAVPAGEASVDLQVNVVQELVHWSRDEGLVEPALRVACAR